MAQHEMQNLIQNWVEQQNKLWQAWMQGVQQMGGSRTAQPWAEGLEHWRHAVEETLETQKKATRAWADQIASIDGGPEEMRHWATEGVKLFDQWTDAQNKMWQQWFEQMSRTGAGTDDDHVKQMMAGWEQMSAQMQDLQRQWSGAFSGAAKPGKSEGDS